MEKDEFVMVRARVIRRDDAVLTVKLEDGFGRAEAVVHESECVYLPTPKKFGQLTLRVPVKPLSVNEAWKGRKFSTPAKKHFEAKMRLLLPKVEVPGPYYRVEYDFYLTQFALTDEANLEKVLTDCLVKRGIIRDDRYIVEHRLRKFPSKEDFVVVRVDGCEMGNKEKI